MVAISSRGQEHLTKVANELASVYGEKRIWSYPCGFTDTEWIASLASKIDALTYGHTGHKNKSIQCDLCWRYFQ